MKKTFTKLFLFVAMYLVVIPLFTVSAHAAGTILIPAYFYPDIWNTPNNWYTMCDTLPEQSVVIMNPASGPGTESNSDYTTVVSYCREQGINVIGYVDTGYGTRSSTTVEDEVDNYYDWYDVDGIFFDQMSSSSTNLSYYSSLYSYVHTNAPNNQELVVGNMGTVPTTDWALDEPVVDTLVIFEGTQTSYGNFSMPGWASGYAPTDFAALVYDTASNDLSSTCSGLDTHGIGYRYITNDNGANPWDILPSYWSTELSTCL